MLRTTPHLLQQATFGWLFCCGKKHRSDDDLGRVFEYHIHVVADQHIAPANQVAPAKDTAMTPTAEFPGKAK
jgi:hypothetical protein